MSAHDRIHKIVSQIKIQQECLKDLQEIKESGRPSGIDPDEASGEISEHLQKNISQLGLYPREYDQYMLTRMMKHGLNDDDMIAWWMNRY